MAYRLLQKDDSASVIHSLIDDLNLRLFQKLCI